jgi:hypothetical protein
MTGQKSRLIDPTSSLLVIIIFHVTVSLAWPVNPENHARCISIRFSGGCHCRMKGKGSIEPVAAKLRFHAPNFTWTAMMSICPVWMIMHIRKIMQKALRWFTDHGMSNHVVIMLTTQNPKVIKPNPHSSALLKPWLQ